ncbi:ATP-dependent sacrificial sulfur transferase LarE [Sulfurospirillum arsenophilum]|uniref:ATP-dependent sacrificial sulfur transferase LarE n=1 Tax=Sulfurospirillum arsenophilum TaxID=56698 RepID=UPI0005AB035C|nr:ATP-dependent sacrificial sulfur transferase LarE [Sulfurospirillum arsenophilum]
MYKKYEHLKEIIASYDSLLVAFSGGVDSSFLLKTAYDVLGDKAIGITASTPYIANWEIADAVRIAKEIGVQHEVVKKPWIEAVKSNPNNRCYICKHALFSSLLDFTQQKSFSAVAEGSNVDDTKEFRPGRVALGELGIKTPLLDAGLTKREIRALSKEIGLSTWDKPSYACLLTRFPYNQTINDKALLMVADAEGYMISQGYGHIRVRYVDGLARIEMPESEMIRFVNDARMKELRDHLKSLGFLHVTLDLEGYRQGSIAESRSEKSA